jgi:hypothetical protein
MTARRKLKKLQNGLFEVFFKIKNPAKLAGLFIHFKT